MLTKTQQIRLILEEEQAAKDKKNIKDPEDKDLLRDDTEKHYDKIDEKCKKQKKIVESKANIKKALLSEAILYLFEMSLNEPDLLKNTRSEMMKRNLVNNFIEENGVDNLLYRFEAKSVLLSEMVETIRKHFDLIMESNKDTENAYTIDMDDRKSFFDSLNMSDIEGVASAIKQRVAMSMEDFVVSNNQTAAEIKEIMFDNKEKTENIRDEKIKEEYDALAGRRIEDLKHKRSYNILESMIQRIANQAMTNEDMKKIYFNENGLDMDKVVDDCEITYTFLEMLNTTKMEKINANYLLDTLNNLA